jgi:hypothetical protein
VVAIEVVVVVIVEAAHDPLVHASQQLGWSLAQALPPEGGEHSAARGRILHRRSPAALVRQHATAGERPHVERTAHRTTAGRQRGRSLPSATASLATPATQWT